MRVESEELKMASPASCGGDEECSGFWDKGGEGDCKLKSAVLAMAGAWINYVGGMMEGPKSVGTSFSLYSNCDYWVVEPWISHGQNYT